MPDTSSPSRENRQGSSGPKAAALFAKPTRPVLKRNWEPNLRALSRLVTTQKSTSIFGFSSLTELLVGFTDYFETIHALEKAGVPRQDIGIYDMSLVDIASTEKQRVDFLQALCDEEQTRLGQKIADHISRRGFLSDWGVELSIQQFAKLDASHEGASRAAVPLHCTGTREWMAEEPCHNMFGSQVSRQGFETLFYTLLSATMMYEAPKTPKPPKTCSYLSDTVGKKFIPPDLVWIMLMRPRVSSYFKPLIPLFEQYFEQHIVMRSVAGGASEHNSRFTHKKFIEATAQTLLGLPDSYWTPFSNQPEGVAVASESSDDTSHA